MAGVVPICNVCLEPYDNEQCKPLVFSPCGHGICKDCLPRLVHKICPQCRSPIEGNTFNRDLLDSIRSIQAKVKHEAGSLEKAAPQKVRKVEHIRREEKMKFIKDPRHWWSSYNPDKNSPETRRTVLNPENREFWIKQLAIIGDGDGSSYLKISFNKSRLEEKKDAFMRLFAVGALAPKDIYKALLEDEDEDPIEHVHMPYAKTVFQRLSADYELDKSDFKLAYLTSSLTGDKSLAEQR